MGERDKENVRGGKGEIGRVGEMEREIECDRWGRDRVRERWEGRDRESARDGERWGER